MLVSLVIEGIPKKDSYISADQGRALAAEFLGWIQHVDPELSINIHDGNGIRPYTVSNLFETHSVGHGKCKLSACSPVWWRITSISRDLSRCIMDKIFPELPAEISLGGKSILMTKATVDSGGHPWAGLTTCEDLAARHLLDHRPRSRHISLEFASPTTFRSKGRNLPFPMPANVFGQWLKKWNAFASIAFPEDLIGYAEDHLIVSKYNLRSEVVRHGRAKHIGACGTCTFLIPPGDPYYQRALQTLADFAFYCGTGAKTSIGMGQTRVWQRV